MIECILTFHKKNKKMGSNSPTKTVILTTTKTVILTTTHPKGVDLCVF